MANMLHLSLGIPEAMVPVWEEFNCVKGVGGKNLVVNTLIEAEEKVVREDSEGTSSPFTPCSPKSSSSHTLPTVGL